MAIKQWGLMVPRGSVDAPQRANILVGYPFAFGVSGWNAVTRSADATYHSTTRASDNSWTQVTRS